jgi:transglutaminase-like putative cysteine protease
MKYRVIHKTVYRYQTTVSLCQNEAYLSLRDTPLQSCQKSELWISPRPAAQYERNDFFGNRVVYFAVQTPHKVLTVNAISDVEIRHPGSILLPEHSPPWEEARDALAQANDEEYLAARPFTLESPFVPLNHQAIRDYALISFTPQRPVMAAARDLMTRIYREFTYDPHFSTIVTPLSEVLAHRRGVCQDFAHLGIACIRAMGLPARYVSGYLETQPPPGEPKLRGADASHAWLAIHVPGLGWVDIDPTNNQIPGEQHITTAYGRDYGDVTPLKGVIFGGGGHELDVSVDVERLEEEA